MSDVSYAESVEVASPVLTCYRHRLDYGANLEAVNPNVTNLSRTDGGNAPGVGATYKFDVVIEGLGAIPTTLTVTEAVEPTRVVNDIDAGLVAHEVCTFTEIPGGTLVEIAATVAVPDDTDDAGRAFVEDSGRAQIRLELDTMKALLES